MLLNGGELDGARLLSPATVRRMTTNALPPDIRFAGTAGDVGTTGRRDLRVGLRDPHQCLVRAGCPARSAASPGAGAWGTNLLGRSGGAADRHTAHPGWDRGLQPVQASVSQSDLRRLPGAASGPHRWSRPRPAAIDPAALATFEGTYRFASSSSRDKQERREFGGLGIELAVQNGVLKVLHPVRNAPAARAGVLANDIITGLDDEATQDMSLVQAIEKMRGPVNTTVRLKIARKGQDGPIELTIARAVIRPEPAGADLRVAVKDGKLLMEGKAPFRCSISSRVHRSRRSRRRATSSSWMATSEPAWRS